MLQQAKSHVLPEEGWICSGPQSVWTEENVDHLCIGTWVSRLPDWLTACYFHLTSLGLDSQNISTLHSVTGCNFPLPLTNIPSNSVTGKAFQMSIQKPSHAVKNEWQDYTVIKLFFFFRSGRLPTCLPSNHVKSPLPYYFFCSVCVCIHTRARTHTHTHTHTSPPYNNERIINTLT